MASLCQGVWHQREYSFLEGDASLISGNPGKMTPAWWCQHGIWWCENGWCQDWPALILGFWCHPRLWQFTEWFKVRSQGIAQCTIVYVYLPVAGAGARRACFIDLQRRALMGHTTDPICIWLCWSVLRDCIWKFIFLEWNIGFNDAVSLCENSCNVSL